MTFQFPPKMILNVSTQITFKYLFIFIYDKQRALTVIMHCRHKFVFFSTTVILLKALNECSFIVRNIDYLT